MQYAENFMNMQSNSNHTHMYDNNHKSVIVCCSPNDHQSMTQNNAQGGTVSSPGANIQQAA